MDGSLTEEEVQSLREAFQLFDTQGSGRVHPRDLKAALSCLGEEARNHPIYHMIATMEEGDSEGMDFDQMLQMVIKASRHEEEGKKDAMGRGLRREDVEMVFGVIDSDGAGYITMEKLQRVVQEMVVEEGQEFTEAELQCMMEVADCDHDGRVTFDDFYRVLSTMLTETSSQ